MMDQYAAWAEDVQSLGLEKLIKERLRFHGGLYLSFVSQFCGCAKNTAKKHLDRLVDQGKATKTLHGEDWLYRHVT